MSDEDRAVALETAGEPREETARDGSTYRLRLVAHGEAEYDWFYNVFANPTLWFLQHYLYDLARGRDVDGGLHTAWERGYVPVNEAFAEAVLAALEVEPEATVFFHDYHLYLAPRAVRERRPDALLAHFVHIPWAEPDYWHVLPEPIRRAIHHGLLANDLVSLHTSRWRRNFIRCAEDIVGGECDYGGSVVTHAGRRTLVTHHPISVDPHEFEELAESEVVLAEEAQILERHRERIVLRVDRTDPSKNVVRGFRAFELYLEEHPEMHGRVVMLALLDPSRQDIPEYAEYVGAIQRAARAVNERFQRDGWFPIDLRTEDNFPQSVAAYKQYDVLLVNALFDGMNLIAKEAPLVNRRDGVLVLSENAGAHEELAEWAVTVNPLDLVSQADAIHEALELPEAERRRRLTAIREHVHEHDLESWIGGLLADLDRVAAHAAR